MKIRVTIAAALALVLTACGGQDKPAGENSSKSEKAETSATSVSPTSSSSTASDASSTSAVASASEAATSSPAAAPMKGDKPSREFVVGKWGTDGDCDLAIDLRADGTSDGPFGNWTYNDGVIGFTDEPDFTVRVTVIDDSTMESTNDDNGKSMKMTRCP